LFLAARPPRLGLAGAFAFDLLQHLPFFIITISS
jgi:hypothetical protein